MAGLCPTTEANLGDGLFNALTYQVDGGAWGIGSDSHISISPVEELRWLEYGMRLQERGRNLLATDGCESTGRSLFDAAITGGNQALGRRSFGITPGARANLLVLDSRHPRLYRRNADELLDSWIFSGNEPAVSDVYVGGARVIENGMHADQDAIAADFRSVLDQLADA